MPIFVLSVNAKVLSDGAFSLWVSLNEFTSIPSETCAFLMISGGIELN